MTDKRKIDHIELAKRSQTQVSMSSEHFYYEPLLASHPTQNSKMSTHFLGHQLDFPLWISSMTGGTKNAKTLNQNLALVARNFKLGMGLGSCRPILSNDEYFDDFNLRPILGPEIPFFANIGIAQLEELLNLNQFEKIHKLIDRLNATGLIIHVNPLQEWFQAEGDRFKIPPIETIATFLKNKKYPVIVKEVGQGMGPQSLRALLELKLDAIELASLGGTNFSKIELMRSQGIEKNNKETNSSEQLANVGHSAEQMIGWLNELVSMNPIYKKTEVIISGGIQNVLQGQYYRETLQMNSVIGQALRFLNHAHDPNLLEQFVISETQTLLMAQSFLKKVDTRNESN